MTFIKPKGILSSNSEVEEKQQTLARLRVAVYLCHKPSLKMRGKRQRKGGMGPLCSLETEKWGNYAEKWADAGGR